MKDYIQMMPWFIQDFIHDNRWSGLRDIQTGVFDVFYESKEHILISSGTSSGKTEAALFPVLTSLHNEPVNTGFGAIYIGPTKALIDDQFGRIDRIIRETGIKVTEWHGDVGQNRKKSALKDAGGILQITPESLQNLIVNEYDNLGKLFGELRFILIDEVHIFCGSRRGSQLLCCLEMLEHVCKCTPRRIGLSATISDMEHACRWLSASTGVETHPVKDSTRKESVISVRYNYFPHIDPGNKDRSRAVTAYYKQLFNDTDGKNCVVFANSRSVAETVATSLTKVKEALGGTNDVYVHHGSLSKTIRKAAEEALSDPSRKVTVVSTSTLELGVDIGSLDLVVQLEPPHSCSSLMQRMGRSGRRNSPQKLIVYCNEDEEKGWNRFGNTPMNLVKAVAMCNLISKGWVEPGHDDLYPYGLLFHQTMEYMKCFAGVRFSDLKKNVLGMFPFSSISEDDYRKLLRVMSVTGQIQRMDDGTLIIGKEGEKTAFGRDFCSVFMTEKEIDVKADGKIIGSVQNIPEIGSCIQLAGHVWEITSFDSMNNIAEVRLSDGSATSSWKSASVDIDRTVMKEMRNVLSCTDTYPFLDQKGQERLDEARRTASDILASSQITERGLIIHPWTGTKEFDTLRRIIGGMSGVAYVKCFQPYQINVTGDISVDDIKSEIESYNENNLISLLDPYEDIEVGKYDDEIPRDLQEKCFASMRLSLDPDIF